MSSRSRFGRWLGIVVATVVLATACGAPVSAPNALPADSDSTTDRAVDQTEPTAVPPTAVPPTVAPDPTAEPKPAPTAVAEPTPAPEATSGAEAEPTSAVPFVIWDGLLQAGDCFNRPEDATTDPPEVVDCNGLHDEELFAVGQFDDGPDAAYPGDENLFDLITDTLCGEASIDFLGAPWHEVPVPVYTLHPSETEWAAGSRFMACSAAAYTEDRQKIGTAAAAGLQTDDVVLARASIVLDDVAYEDFRVLDQTDDFRTTGTLTDLQFDLPLRRPFAIERGFLFTARPFGEEGHATNTYGYDWRTKEITDLGSVLPGYELASTIITADNIVVVAARETPDDDWDLWRSSNGGTDSAVLLAGGEGNQQYPALSPDNATIVFSDDGDLWVIGTDGSNLRQLTSGPAQDWESAVSPDGQTVVYSSTTDGQDDIFSISIDGGEAVNLTNHPADEFWPTFSPDGERLYFTTNRLQPADSDSRQVLMVMRPDGSETSWFGITQAAQSIVIDPEIAAQVRWTAPTIDERHNYNVVEGEPGEMTTWAHPDGQLQADLPAGWRVAELDNNEGFVAGPRVDAFFDIWEADGVLVERITGETKEEFFARYDDLVVVESCQQFDGTNGIEEPDAGTSLLSGNFTCGDHDAIAGAILIYSAETASGVIIEGQRDNWPDAEADEALLLAIARSVQWG